MRCTIRSRRSSTSSSTGFEGAAEIDFSAQFSVPFPSQVFLTMLGLPMDELPRFLTMKDGIIRPQEWSASPSSTPRRRPTRRATATSIYDYFDDMLNQRRRAPKDDLLSQLLATEVEGDRLTHEEILDICFLFFIAGLDTVSASLDCFFRYLAEEPDQRRTRRQPSTWCRGPSRSSCGGKRPSLPSRG